MKIAAIVPAYNEATRIKGVLSTICEIEMLNQIVVVDDGSTDGTGEATRQFPKVDLVTLPKNKGKGGAMYAGATHSDADVILFLDADLIGLTKEHVENLLKPMVQDNADMSVGVFRGGRLVTDLAQILVPYISGQRAVKRDLFLKVNGLDSARSGVEMALTRYALKHGFTVKSVVITGVTHPMKEEKLGPWRGFLERARMYFEITRFIVDGKIR